MSLEKLSKYKLDRETMSNIRGAGYGTVTCEDGTQFSHTASSIEAVRDRGDFWCRRHGHGGGATYVWVGEGEFTSLNNLKPSCTKIKPKLAVNYQLFCE